MSIKETNTKTVSCERFIALIAGESNVGKTSLAKTLNPKDTLIISAESGLLSLKGTNISVWEIDEFADMLSVIERLKKGVPFKNIYIDSLTEILDKHLEELKKQYSKKDTFVMYDEYTRAGIWLIKELRDIPYNVIFTCLVTQEKDGLVLIDQYDFAGSKLKYKMKSFFDLCLHMKIMKFEDGVKERVLITNGEESNLAKDRSGSLAKIEKADLTYIMNKVLNKE